jgi:hypothetical protein
MKRLGPERNGERKGTRGLKEREREQAHARLAYPLAGSSRHFPTSPRLELSPLGYRTNSTVELSSACDCAVAPRVERLPFYPLYLWRPRIPSSGRRCRQESAHVRLQFTHAPEDIGGLATKEVLRVKGSIVLPAFSGASWDEFRWRERYWLWRWARSSSRGAIGYNWARWPCPKGRS